MERGRLLNRCRLRHDWEHSSEKIEKGRTFYENSFTIGSALAVGGFSAVLPLIVVFGNVQGDFKIGRFREVWLMTEQDGAEGQAGDVFEHVSVLDGFGWGFAPGKGSV